MEEIKILSVNCQGLGDITKRKDVFSYLKNLNYNIYCIQDTHFTENIENIVRNMWGFECYFSSFKSNSRGVAILINNNFEFEFLQQKKDTNGNYLLLKAMINNFQVLLCNVYAPNTVFQQYVKFYR